MFNLLQLRADFLNAPPPFLQLFREPGIFLPQLLGALDYRLNSLIQLLEDFK